LNSLIPVLVWFIITNLLLQGLVVLQALISGAACRNRTTQVRFGTCAEPNGFCFLFTASGLTGYL